MIDNQGDALTALKQRCQTDTPPIVTEPELQAILAQTQRATMWKASTAYAIGDEVIPVTRNGHRFKCVIAGTSSTTEPSWLKADNATVLDGSTLIWQETGPEVDIFHMTAAIQRTFDLKLSKAAIYIGSEDGLNDTFEHLKTLADRNRAYGVG